MYCHQVSYCGYLQTHISGVYICGILCMCGCEYVGVCVGVCGCECVSVYTCQFLVLATFSFSCVFQDVLVKLGWMLDLLME